MASPPPPWSPAPGPWWATDLQVLGYNVSIMELWMWSICIVVLVATMIFCGCGWQRLRRLRRQQQAERQASNWRGAGISLQAHVASLPVTKQTEATTDECCICACRSCPYDFHARSPPLLTRTGDSRVRRLGRPRDR